MPLLRAGGTFKIREKMELSTPSPQNPVPLKYLKIRQLNKNLLV